MYAKPSFLRALALVAVALLSSRARAQSNWLVNGDAEAGDTSGWTDPIAHGFNVTNSASLVYAGAFSFHPGLTGPSGVWNNELRQDVDLSSLAAMIDAGTVTSVFSCVGRTNEGGGSSDPGRTRLEFLSSSGALLSAYDTGVFSPYNTWLTYADSRVVPATARTARVRLIGSRSVGASTDCFFDDLVLRMDCGAATYCAGKVNSLGCTPSIDVSGVASLSSSTLVVGATQVLNNKSGLLFWGFAPTAAPFQGGTLCVQPPTLRTAVQLSGGSPSGADCSGAFSFAFDSSFLASANLAVDDVVYCQYWSRDPASASTTSLSNAAQFRVCL